MCVQGSVWPKGGGSRYETFNQWVVEAGLMFVPKDHVVSSKKKKKSSMPTVSPSLSRTVFLQLITGWSGKAWWGTPGCGASGDRQHNAKLSRKSGLRSVPTLFSRPDLDSRPSPACFRMHGRVRGAAKKWAKQWRDKHTHTNTQTFCQIPSGRLTE